MKKLSIIEIPRTSISSDASDWLDNQTHDLAWIQPNWRLKIDAVFFACKRDARFFKLRFC